MTENNTEFRKFYSSLDSARKRRRDKLVADLDKDCPTSIHDLTKTALILTDVCVQTFNISVESLGTALDRVKEFQISNNQENEEFLQSLQNLRNGIDEIDDQNVRKEREELIKLNENLLANKRTLDLSLELSYTNFAKYAYDRHKHSLVDLFRIDDSRLVIRCVRSVIETIISLHPIGTLVVGLNQLLKEVNAQDRTLKIAHKYEDDLKSYIFACHAWAISTQLMIDQFSNLATSNHPSLDSARRIIDGRIGARIQELMDIQGSSD